MNSTAFTEPYTLTPYEATLAERCVSFLDWAIFTLYKILKTTPIDTRYSFDFRVKMLGHVAAAMRELELQTQEYRGIVFATLFYRLPMIHPIVATLFRTAHPMMGFGPGAYEHYIDISKIYEIASLDFVRSLIFNSQRLPDKDFAHWFHDSVCYFENQHRLTASSCPADIVRQKKQKILEMTKYAFNHFVNIKLSPESETALWATVKLVIREVGSKHIDASHGFYHSLEAMLYVLKIAWLMRNLHNARIIDEETMFTALVAILVHDLVDHKYATPQPGESAADVEARETDLLMEQLPVSEPVKQRVRAIITHMSFSKIRREGVPTALQGDVAFDLVVTADLLCGYSVERCMIYNFHKVLDDAQSSAGNYIRDDALAEHGLFGAVLEHAKHLVDTRVAGHLPRGEIRVAEARSLAATLERAANQKLVDFRNLVIVINH